VQNVQTTVPSGAKANIYAAPDDVAKATPLRNRFIVLEAQGPSTRAQSRKLDAPSLGMTDQGGRCKKLIVNRETVS